MQYLYGSVGTCKLNRSPSDTSETGNPDSMFSPKHVEVEVATPSESNSDFILSLPTLPNHRE